MSKKQLFIVPYSEEEIAAFKKHLVTIHTKKTTNIFHPMHQVVTQGKIWRAGFQE